MQLRVVLSSRSQERTPGSAEAVKSPCDLVALYEQLILLSCGVHVGLVKVDATLQQADNGALHAELHSE